MAAKWCTKLEVALKSSPIVFECHPSNFKVTWLKKIVEFDPNWAFPDCKSSLNSPMAIKCIKLETAKERWPIVFQCHPSSFKVTRDKTSPILTQIGRFWTIGRSQLSNTLDLPCFFFNFRCVHRVFHATALKPNLWNFKTLLFRCVMIFCNRKSYKGRKKKKCCRPTLVALA